MDIHSRGEAAARIGKKHDVSLEPFGLVEVHDADDICPARLERKRFDFAGFLGVLVERVTRIREAAALFDDLPHAIERMQQVARLHPAGGRRRQRQIPGMFEDSIEGRCQLAAPASTCRY